MLISIFSPKLIYFLGGLALGVFCGVFAVLAIIHAMYVQIYGETEENINEINLENTDSTANFLVVSGVNSEDLEKIQKNR
jgi:hypothetical protein